MGRAQRTPHAVAFQNFFDTTMGAVSLRALFAGTRRSHGRSNCKFDAALGLLNLWQKANRFAARLAAEVLGWRKAGPCSSVGRARPWEGRGHRFDPGHGLVR